jgi:hypothetical protein
LNLLQVVQTALPSVLQAKHANQLPKRATVVQQQGSVQQLILELVQPLPKADYTSSNGTLLSGSAKVLQQLRQAIAAGGMMSSLRITADSFSRATGQTLLGLGEHASCRSCCYARNKTTALSNR